MTRKPRTKNEEPIIEPNGAEQLVKATKELARILRIKEAQKRSPELSFFASPWSPPTWMKFPKAYNYGRLVDTEENLKAIVEGKRDFRF